MSRLGEGRFAAEGKANERGSKVRGISHGAKDMGRIEGSRRAGRTAGSTEAGEIKIGEQCKAICLVHGETKSVRKYTFEGRNKRAGGKGGEGFTDRSPKIGSSARGEYRRRQETLQGNDAARNRGQVFRAGPPLVLVAATKKNGCGLKRRADEQDSRAFWPVKLVRTTTDKIRFELVDGGDRLLAKPLDGVGMEYDAPRMADAAQLGDGFDGPHFIIGGHERNENRVRPQSAL